MLVTTGTPYPTNGQTPMSPARIARAQAALSRVDRAEKFARFAVLGYCNAPGSYWPLGLNVMNDVAQNPMTPLPNVLSSSTVLTSGSGVINSQGGREAAAPIVVPMNSGAPPLPPPTYGPLTTDQGVQVPIIPPGMARGARLRAFNRPVCGVDGQDWFGRPACGQAPGWGDSLAFLRPPCFDSPASASSGMVNWMKDHAGLLALLVGAAVLTTSTSGRRA
jgi:hypothetical protein